MNYFEYQQNNLPIGSGVVEAACKNLVAFEIGDLWGTFISKHRIHCSGVCLD